MNQKKPEMENLKSFIVKHSTIYGVIFFVYLVLAIWYAIHLFNFNCDGFGCRVDANKI
jgi:fumarate reductase subunit D